MFSGGDRGSGVFIRLRSIMDARLLAMLLVLFVEVEQYSIVLQIQEPYISIEERAQVFYSDSDFSKCDCI